MGQLAWGFAAGAGLKRLPMTTRIADEFSFIRQRLDEIEGKGKPPLGKLGKKLDTADCDPCKGRGYLLSSGPSGKVSCPYCDPGFRLSSGACACSRTCRSAGRSCDRTISSLNRIYTAQKFQAPRPMGRLSRYSGVTMLLQPDRQPDKQCARDHRINSD
jgi:hypothetical protein